MSNIECYKCGIAFTVPDHWHSKRREDKESFWCPNGHPQAYTDSAVDRMRRERDLAIQQKARLEEESAAKEKEIERLKKRFSAGICPCCTRTFTNMARHMKTKHPEMLASNVVKIKRKVT